MPASKKIMEFMQRSSWIRKMFEEGARLKKEHGAQNVFDFSLGNPNLDPVKEVNDAIVQAAMDFTPGVHGYMPNAGFPAVRAAVAQKIREAEGVEINENSIVMTVGAGGGLNVTLKTILNPGDEVIVPKPYFVEYVFYIDNHGGKTVLVPTLSDFSLDLDAIAQAVTPNTAALLINSPNNPTGKVYTEQQINDLARLLEKKSAEIGRAIVLISDEPYRGIIYDNIAVPSILKAYSNSIVVTSFSKDLSLPGERLGYIAMNPKMDDAASTIDGLVLANRILGFVNAPSLIQRAVKGVLTNLVDVSVYRRRRDRLYSSLVDAGYDCVKPEGAFYLFPKSPISDDVQFVANLQKKLILTVPGTGFGAPGYFRIAYCVSDETIEGSLKGFREAIKEI
ncbi:pyridoxal phosphate-dependent aminotransferase [Desulfomonile tiedjei]|uniref:Aminotransferase n=1 Tax=Desulfomonile tiedjei (strain ATCC 49306 / DSM 6799 / DCB-1) TaxID=706587 RepID=I4C824_DESTA|nr:pyridoxal phosphate-dependent aminotransferase [Desulfomonile tiedjei]AFM25715.1 aspartate/tyrosine/aromatic aminotransferase [Desulfomonile tiedjei DSM 6799]